MAASLSSPPEPTAARRPTRRRHGRRIRRRLAGLSLATLLAASGAAIVQFATGRPAPARTAIAGARSSWLGADAVDAMTVRPLPASHPATVRSAVITRAS